MTVSRANPIHVFDSHFLEWLARREPSGPTASEAEYAGPWTVRHRENGYAVLRESDDEQRVPDAQLNERETALLLAAILPAMGREQRYRLATSKEGAGVDVEALGGGRLEKVGWLRHGHLELIEALSVVEWLLRSPASLAMVLQAASYGVLVQAGAILERRLAAECLQVRDVMRTGGDMPRVETSTAIRDTIFEMSRGRLGIVAVTDAEGRLAGCLSDGDLRRLLAGDDTPLDSTAGEHMTPRPRTIDGGALASAALKLLQEHRVSSLFICDSEGRLEGVVSLNDLWRLETFGRASVLRA